MLGEILKSALQKHFKNGYLVAGTHSICVRRRVQAASNVQRLVSDTCLQSGKKERQVQSSRYALLLLKHFHVPVSRAE